MPEMIYTEEIIYAYDITYIENEDKNLDFQISEAIKVEEINNYIKQFEWYLPPFFYQHQYNRIKYFKDTNTGDNEKITEVLIDTFFDTRILAIHMEAFYKKLPHLKEFSFLIDHGIILFLQYDYAGAINTLIPVIEGVIRSYLKTKGNVNPSFKHLKDSFDQMKNDIVDYHKNIYISKELKEVDYNPLLAKHKVYLTKWFSVIKDFIINRMYLDSKNGTPSDNLNRHSIIHGLTNDIYYSLSNAIKSYISIQYLAWIFIQMTEGFSTVPDIEENEYKE